MSYAVFELLEGETLRQKLERGPLPVRKAVGPGVQVCRGPSSPLMPGGSSTATSSPRTSPSPTTAGSRTATCCRAAFSGGATKC
jgi:hypothetical protein